MRKRYKTKDPSNCDEVCERCANRFSCRKRILIGYERLAFGSTSDAFRLIMSESGDRCDVGQLDLFNVAEVKKPKDGAMEIKFFDRLKALDQMSASPDDNDASLSFYEAISACADNLKGGSGCDDP